MSTYTPNHGSSAIYMLLFDGPYLRKTKRIVFIEQLRFESFNLQ
jgi:hypothetical protein